MLEHVQGGPLSQVLDDRLEEAQVRERVMTSLNEQQGNADLLKMRGPIRTGLAGRMQWESQKHEPADPREGRLCLRLRSHTTAEGPAAGKQRQIRREPRDRGDRGAHRRLTKRRRIGSSALSLHIGELIAQGGDAPFRESHGNAPHRRMLHARARSVGQDEHRSRRAGASEQPGHAMLCADIDGQALIRRSSHSGHAGNKPPLYYLYIKLCGRAPC